ncbi:molecular chaperone, partial [Vibrio parahaemolyticus]|nr:molecular chaperone [Vibrio parahaemolyticus]
MKLSGTDSSIADWLVQQNTSWSLDS